MAEDLGTPALFSLSLWVLCSWKFLTLEEDDVLSVSTEILIHVPLIDRSWWAFSRKILKSRGNTLSSGLLISVQRQGYGLICITQFPVSSVQLLVSGRRASLRRKLYFFCCKTSIYLSRNSSSSPIHIHVHITPAYIHPTTRTHRLCKGYFSGSSHLDAPEYIAGWKQSRS